MSEEVALAFAADANFAEPLAVAVHSSLRHVPPSIKVKVVIADDGIGSAGRTSVESAARRVREDASVEWFAVHDVALSEGVPVTAALPRSTYLRLLVPHLVEARRILFLDSDTMTVNTLAHLLDCDLGQSCVAAVPDFAVSRFVQHPCAHGFPQSSLNEPYFNAGVMLIDASLWRDQNISQRAIKFVCEHRDGSPFADQDGINWAVSGVGQVLSSCYNVQIGGVRDGHTTLLDEAIPDWRHRCDHGASILHFNGPWKPWLARRPSRLRSLYREAMIDAGIVSRGSMMVRELKQIPRDAIRVIGRRSK